MARGATEDEESLASLNGRWAVPTDVAGSLRKLTGCSPSSTLGQAGDS